MTKQIERVDTIPIIIAIVQKMNVQQIIDKLFKPHGNWSGLSYGQLAALLITYILHSMTHRLSGMETWVNLHKEVIEKTTGWKVGVKDATDDRLGILTGVLGANDEKIYEFQVLNSRGIISAYQLPTEIARYDTTSFNVCHQPEDKKKGILEFGHSKNHRPDLLQFKQGLAVLDPAGVPILSETFAGNKADDPCYLPAWRHMVKTIGRADFLFVADCKAASMETRTSIDREGGFYLFPLPMTGDTPKHLKTLVLTAPEAVEQIVLMAKADQGEKERIAGKGFVVKRQQEIAVENNELHCLEEKWIVSCSDAHAQRRIKSFYERLDRAVTKINALKPKNGETRDSFRAKANKILKTHDVEDYLRIEVNESITSKKKYIGKGRPGKNTSYEMIDVRNFSLVFERNEKAVKEFEQLAGWRIYVTNDTSDRMTLNRSTQYYRDEWVVERGFHRFKKGHIPALPLFLRLPERIKGLMLLLTIALQVLTLIEFVSRKELSKNNETISGLVPGNPKMKTTRPTAERLLAQFDGIHLLVENKGKQVAGVMIEPLSGLQKKILSILCLPETIYDLSFKSKIKAA